MADLVNSIDEYGRALGCRFVLMVADTSGDDEVALPPELEAIEEAPEPEEPQEPDSELQVIRRQAGQCIFIGDRNFPSNDDLAAIRSEIGKMGRTSGSILVTNANYGEVELMASVANELATIFSVYNADDLSELEKQRMMVFDHNTRTTSNIRKVPEASILTVKDNQNLEALVLLDPKPGDFKLYSRHLKHGGLLMIVSTSGSPPDRPEALADKFRELTPCVLAHYRKVETGDANK